MKKWRLIEDDSHNACVEPWTDAIGIEEIDHELAVPSIVCWFCRGWDRSLVQHVVDLHNNSLGE